MWYSTNLYKICAIAGKCFQTILIESVSLGILICNVGRKLLFAEKTISTNGIIIFVVLRLKRLVIPAIPDKLVLRSTLAKYSPALD